jgi:hypothetical protein
VFFELVELTFERVYFGEVIWILSTCWSFAVELIVEEGVGRFGGLRTENGSMCMQFGFAAASAKGSRGDQLVVGSGLVLSAFDSVADF